MSTVIVIRIPNEHLDRQQCETLLRPVIDARHNHLHLCHGAETKETYIYLSDSLGEPLTPNTPQAGSADKSTDRLAAHVLRHYPDARAELMEVTLDLAGQAQGHTPAWHYVVETDVDAEAENDFNQWYTQEHMPGLAAVPGTIRTMRLFKRDGAPRYHALYLLQNRETFGSAPWLAVRATDWSSRVRPHFRNTKRTMFTIINEGIR